MKGGEEEAGREIWKAAMRGAVVAIVGIVLVFPMAAVVLSQVKEVKGADERNKCLNNLRQVCLSMIQYAGEYDDEYPGALNEKNPDKEPTQYRFARLLKLGYLNAPRTFYCAAMKVEARPDPAKLSGDTITDSTEESVVKAYLTDELCSYGVDPKLKHTHSASRAMIADRPHRDYWGTGANSPEAGKEGSNSENHGGDGQNVAYNDGHVKWGASCRDDSGIDPNIYAVNAKVVPEDDSNIDFGVKAEQKK